jgi:hypothetical protein
VEIDIDVPSIQAGAAGACCAIRHFKGFTGFHAAKLWRPTAAVPAPDRLAAVLTLQFGNTSVFCGVFFSANCQLMRFCMLQIAAGPFAGL